MNIAVDAFPLSFKSASGIPNYVKQVFAHILAIDQGNEYFLYCKNPFPHQAAPNVHARFSSRATESSPSYGNTLWLFSKGVRMMRRDRIDLLWGTRQMLPPYLPGGIKKLLVSYDLVWHYYPATMENYNRVVSAVFFKHSLRSAQHIITISRATAQGLTEVVGIPPDRISVIYPAGSGYRPLDKDASAASIAAKYGARRDYVLTVSTVEPRKNLPTLLRAWAGLRGEGYQLLIAGARGWKDSAVSAEYERLGFREEEVKFLGYIPDEDMNELYSGARVFVFPSLYEGFGIPVIEALASGTPAIVSNSSSLPEAAGDAGVLLDPMDDAAWRMAIRDLMGDEARRAEMARRGLAQAARFTWDEAARRTLQAFGDLYAK